MKAKIVLNFSTVIDLDTPLTPLELQAELEAGFWGCGVSIHLDSPSALYEEVIRKIGHANAVSAIVVRQE